MPAHHTLLELQFLTFSSLPPFPSPLLSFAAGPRRLSPACRSSFLFVVSNCRPVPGRLLRLHRGLVPCVSKAEPVASGSEVVTLREAHPTVRSSSRLWCLWTHQLGSGLFWHAEPWRGSAGSPGDSRPGPPLPQNHSLMEDLLNLWGPGARLRSSQGSLLPGTTGPVGGWFLLARGSVRTPVSS